MKGSNNKITISNTSYSNRSVLTKLGKESHSGVTELGGGGGVYISFFICNSPFWLIRYVPDWLGERSLLFTRFIPDDLFLFALFLGDFPRAWALLLEFIESSALCRNAEVSLAALKSFQEILQINKDKGDDRTFKLGLELAAPKLEVMQRTLEEAEEKASKMSLKDCGIDDVSLWSNAWKVWLSIGTEVTVPPIDKTADMYIPAQPFLSALIQIFPALYAHIKDRFVAADLHKLSTVLQRALAVPVHSDASPFIVPSYQEVCLTPLQEAVLSAVDVLQKVSQRHSERP